MLITSVNTFRYCAYSSCVVRNTHSTYKEKENTEELLVENTTN